MTERNTTPRGYDRAPLPTAEKARVVAGCVRDLDDIIAYCRNMKDEFRAFADDGFIASDDFLTMLTEEYDDLTGSSCHLSPHVVVDSMRTLVEEIIAEQENK